MKQLKNIFITFFSFFLLLGLSNTSYAQGKPVEKSISIKKRERMQKRAEKKKKRQEKKARKELEKRHKKLQTKAVRKRMKKHKKKANKQNSI